MARKPAWGAQDPHAGSAAGEPQGGGAPYPGVQHHIAQGQGDGGYTCEAAACVGAA